MVTVLNMLDAHRQKNEDLLRISRDRLALWGIAEDQIDNILKMGKADTHLTIRAPISGHVLKKYVKEGQYVDEGSPLYDVVDLSTVWIQAQVFEDDMSFLPFTHEPLVKASGARLPFPSPLGGKGAGGEGASVDDAIPRVVVTARAFPGESFERQLNFVLPHVDLDTRTVVVRMELDNPDHSLRPGTTVTARLKIAPRRLAVLHKAIRDDLVRHTAAEMTGQALFGAPLLPGFEALVQSAASVSALEQNLVLAVPEVAVIDTGSMKIVYREVVPGEYEGVRVLLGPRMIGPSDVIYYPVLGGLAHGDAVVTSGAFLVDAETRLNPAVGSIYFGGSSGSKGAQTGSTVRPSTPEDEDLKIKSAISKLPQRDRKLAEEQKYCPVQKGSLLGSMGVPPKVLVLGQPVFVCCSGCEKDALAHPQETLEKVVQYKKGKGP
jgi:Cu(I)/Ag(I) efflux system membrane fusion protein